MPTRSRRTRRLLRHHLPLAAVSALTAVAVAAVLPSDSSMTRISMGTAYAGLLLLGLSLATGPLNVLRSRANPVSTDLRRDIGIWAGLLSVMHFAAGWQVHMKHRYMYWLTRSDGVLPFALRLDAFGFANHAGIIGVLFALFLLALSNDRSLRALGSVRWKGLQRWNYALFALTAVHGVLYQVLEKRAIGFVALLALLLGTTLALQLTGYRARRARRAEGRSR